DRRSTRAISPADETAKAGLKRVPSRAPIRTRHGRSYNQYPALRFNTRKGIWFFLKDHRPLGDAQANENSEQAVHSPPTRVPLQSIYGVAVQYPERDLILPVGAPPTVRTAIEPNLRASRPFAPDTGAPTINSRRCGSIPGMGSGVPVGEPPRCEP